MVRAVTFPRGSNKRNTSAFWWRGGSFMLCHRSSLKYYIIRPKTLATSTFPSSGMFQSNGPCPRIFKPLPLGISPGRLRQKTLPANLAFVTIAIIWPRSELDAIPKQPDAKYQCAALRLCPYKDSPGSKPTGTTPGCMTTWITRTISRLETLIYIYAIQVQSWNSEPISHRYTTSEVI